MVVELDAFSGRPNPRWQLTEREAAELAQLIAGLEPAPGAPSPRPPGLGYRGFRLKGSAGETYWVYRDLVQSPDLVLADPYRRVESFLRDHMPEALNGLRPWLEATRAGAQFSDRDRKIAPREGKVAEALLEVGVRCLGAEDRAIVEERTVQRPVTGIS